MAPLPDNNTDCFWLDYTDGQNSHSLQVRYNSAVATVANVMSLVHNFLVQLSSELYTLTVQGARVRAKNSNVSSPVVWSGDVTYGSFAMPANLAPREICFLGRSGDGRRVRWFLFGWNGPTPSPFRVGITPETAFDGALQVLITAQEFETFLTISGQSPTLYTYVDVNYNSYYEEKTR